MRTIYDSKIKKDVILVGQGELAISDNSKLISTTLGSCIAVCLFDLEMGMGGMNHYMLPAPAMKEECIVFSRAKYGIISMEMLLNELLKKGGDRTRIQAKIFGGADMFSFGKKNGKAVPYEKASPLRMEQTIVQAVGVQNIDFAKKYLQMENIPIASQDVGGDHARKIYFYPGSGKVKLFRLRSQKIEDVIKKELQYRRSIEKEAEAQNKQSVEESIDDKLTLF